MCHDKKFALFAPHTDWYEFIVNVGYVPTELATTQATLAMLEYDSYTFGKEHWLYEKRKISEKVKFLIEKDYSKKEIVITAIEENGFNKINDMFEFEKNLISLKEETDKLSDWIECNES